MTAGSDNELRSYDGENLARQEDVVVVSINHRLGVLGFLNLMEYAISTLLLLTFPCSTSLQHSVG
jgi:carboxylesterase type B